MQGRRHMREAPAMRRGIKRVRRIRADLGAEMRQQAGGDIVMGGVDMPAGSSRDPPARPMS